MRLRKISWNNVGPYGNKIQTIELPDAGGLWMVLGKNGNGKCLSKKTKLSIQIDNKEVMTKFLNFLNK